MKEKILVIQLSRYGDILMTLPLLKKLSNKYSVYFLINKIFNDEIIFNNLDINVIDIDFNKYYTLFSDNNIKNNIVFFNELIQKINKISFSKVINLSSQPVFSVITTLIKSNQKYGLYMMYDRSFGIYGKNSAFYFEMGFTKKLNHLHQMDYYKTVIDNEKYSYKEYLPFDSLINRDIFKKYNIKKSDNDVFIAVQPSASMPKKEFNKAKLNILLNEIIKENKNIKIIILGSNNEKESNQIFNNQNFYNLTGKTKISDLISILYNIDLLLTNDTGTMHFAGVFKKKILLIPYGSAFYYETSAYSENVFILPPKNCDCYPCSPSFVCNDYKCKEDNFNEIKDTILYLTNETDIEKNRFYDKKISKTDIRDVNLYKSVFLPDGYIYHFPLNKNKINYIDYIGWLYHNIWKNYFINQSINLKEINKTLENYYILDKEIIEKIITIFNQYMNLYLQSYTILNNLDTNNIEIRLKQFSIILNNISYFEEEYTVLKPLKNYRSVRFHSVDSTDTITIAESYKIYFKEWLRVFNMSIQ